MGQGPAGDLWDVLLDIQTHTGEVTGAAVEQPDRGKQAVGMGVQLTEQTILGFFLILE